MTIDRPPLPPKNASFQKLIFSTFQMILNKKKIGRKKIEKNFKKKFHFFYFFYVGFGDEPNLIT